MFLACRDCAGDAQILLDSVCCKEVVPCHWLLPRSVWGLETGNVHQPHACTVPSSGRDSITLSHAFRTHSKMHVTLCRAVATHGQNVLCYIRVAMFIQQSAFSKAAQMHSSRSRLSLSLSLSLSQSLSLSLSFSLRQQIWGNGRECACIFRGLVNARGLLLFQKKDRLCKGRKATCRTRQSHMQIGSPPKCTWLCFFLVVNAQVCCSVEPVFLASAIYRQTMKHRGKVCAFLENAQMHGRSRLSFKKC